MTGAPLTRNEPTTANHEATSVNSGLLIDLIDSELEELDRNLARAGWTIWAIIGAIGACIWMLLEEIEKGTYKPEFAYLIWISAFFSSIPILFVWRSLTLSDGPSKPDRFFYSRSRFARARPAMLVDGAIGGIVALLMWRAFDISGRPPFTLVACVTLSAHLTLDVLGLALSLINFPIVTPVTRRGRWFATFVLAVFVASCVVSAISMVRHLVSLNYQPRISDVRIAMIGIAIFVLIRVLSSVSGSSPLRSVLVGLRRDLGLGIVSLEATRRQLEIALWGLRAADHVAPQIAEVLRIIQRFDAELNEVSRLAERIPEVSQLPRKEGESANSPSIGKILVEAITRHLILGAELMIRDVGLQVATIKQRRMMLKSTRELAADDGVELRSLEKELASRVDKYNASVRSAHAMIVKHLNRVLGQHFITSLNATRLVQFDQSTGDTMNT